MIVVESTRGSTIKDITIKVADETDFEFIQSLVSLGVNRNVASLVTYLKDVKEGSSRDSEMATGMRQPEVSVAMQTMREMNWVSEHEIKGEGKGRPLKIYALRSTIDEIEGIIFRFRASQMKNEEAYSKLKAVDPRYAVGFGEASK